MPLIRLSNAKLIYFAHVPKCAGSTIERYLETRFGSLGFLDRQYGAIDVADRWSRTSPQHMPEQVRQRYLPDDFLDASFAIVRHPATRLRSVFLFQREIQGGIATDQKFESWLASLSNVNASPFALDGHLRPMTDCVPEQATVFALEAGLPSVIDWLDVMSGTTAPDVPLKPLNVLHRRLQSENRAIPQVVLSQEALERVAELYAADYARFEYDLRPPEQDTTE
ncbi:MAG: sulfotransferase family 2 domain-containing protein [Sulfitobacter sp.]